MLNKLVLLSCLLYLQSQQGFSQQIVPQVIASAGSSATVSSIHVDWTVGETFTHTLAGTNNIVTQGFHQPDLIISAIERLPEGLGRIDVFPNPVDHEMQMVLELARQSNVRIAFTDITGKELWTTSLDVLYHKEMIDVTALPSGVYFLQFVIDDSYTHTFKIQKIR